MISYTETRAALSAAHRLGRIAARTRNSAIRSFDALWPAVTTIGIDDALAQTAGGLAQQYALRGYDAVQLACALKITSGELVLATWDRDLSEAALEAGLIVAPAKL